MGLDVYLYRILNHDAVAAWEAEQEREHEAISQRLVYFDLSKEDERTFEGFNRWANKIGGAEMSRRYDVAEAEKVAWDAAHPPPGEKTKIERASALHPEHYFKIGYLRSSYNGSGIDDVLGNAIGTRLSDIFEPGDEYEFQPNWTEARARAVAARSAYAEFLAKNGSLQAEEVTLNPFVPPTIQSEKEAVALVVREIEKHKGDSMGGDYSSSEGEFHLTTPLQVVALIPGTTKRFFGLKDGREAAFYVVFRNTEGAGRYTAALDVTIEMIDWVLAQPDPQHFYLHWSS